VLLTHRARLEHGHAAAPTPWEVVEIGARLRVGSFELEDLRLVPAAFEVADAR
jgi:hypothetical protein